MIYNHTKSQTHRITHLNLLELINVNLVYSPHSSFFKVYNTIDFYQYLSGIYCKKITAKRMLLRSAFKKIYAL